MGIFALVLSAVMGALALNVSPAAAPGLSETVAVAPIAPLPLPVVRSHSPLLDPAFAGGVLPSSFAESSPLGTQFASRHPEGTHSAPPAPSLVPPQQIAALAPPPVPEAAPRMPDLEPTVPLPMPRPPELRFRDDRGPFRRVPRQIVQQSKPLALPVTPPDDRTFLEKLFGARQPSGPALAYATPETGILDRLNQAARPSSWSYGPTTAVYDISAHTVYLPNGVKLEAHSGLGDLLDDPTHVNARNRGATPPHVYELTRRESLFHGVQALRLNPVGPGSVFGRNGLLAHTFMLGPNGDSNGCVSFRNYNAFLQAFMRGDVRRLVVVARLG